LAKPRRRSAGCVGESSRGPRCCRSLSVVCSQWSMVDSQQSVDQGPTTTDHRH
jgi:hypothetical protein